MVKGWKSESARHALARKGIETGRKPTARVVSKNLLSAEQLFEELKSKISVERNVKDFWDIYGDSLKTKIEQELAEGKSVSEALDRAEDLAQEYMDEEDPEATITVYENGEEKRIIIKPYNIYDETAQYGDDFMPVWHKTDAWRGYYEIEAKGWVQIHADTALSYSEDEDELKKFNDELIEECKNRGIPIAQAVSRTSNLFSASVDYFVQGQHAKQVEDIVNELKTKYRDDERFTSTALTGADPSE